MNEKQPGEKPRTYGDLMSDVQACTTKEQANDLVRVEIARMLALEPQMLPEQARATLMHNIGYLSGYHSRAEAARILALFETRHPFFGAIEEWPKSAEEMVSMGYQLGMQRRIPRGVRHG